MNPGHSKTLLLALERRGICVLTNRVGMCICYSCSDGEAQMAESVAAHRHSLPLRAQGGHSLLARLGFLLATLCSRADTFGGHIFDPTWHEPSFSLVRRIFDILFFYSAPSPVTFPSRGLVTAVKPCFKALTYALLARPSLRQHIRHLSAAPPNSRRLPLSQRCGYLPLPMLQI